MHSHRHHGVEGYAVALAYLDGELYDRVLLVFAKMFSSLPLPVVSAIKSLSQAGQGFSATCYCQPSSPNSASLAVDPTPNAE